MTKESGIVLLDDSCKEEYKVTCPCCEAKLFVKCYANYDMTRVGFGLFEDHKKEVKDE